MQQDDVVAKAEALLRRAYRISGVAQERRSAAEAASRALASSKARAELLEKAKIVLTHLLDTTASADLKGMDNLVTYGLRTVYPEKNLEFHSEVVDTGKKVAIEMVTKRNGKAASKDQSGSITVLESLLIRMLAMLKLNKARFLVADEPFAAIGQDHINNIGTLLEELSTRLGMDLLLFTHNPGVSDACMFRATLGGDDQLKLTKVGGSDNSGSVHAIEHSTSDAPIRKKASRPRKPKEAADA